MLACTPDRLGTIPGGFLLDTKNQPIGKAGFLIINSLFATYYSATGGVSTGASGVGSTVGISGVGASVGISGTAVGSSAGGVVVGSSIVEN